MGVRRLPDATSHAFPTFWFGAAACHGISSASPEAAFALVPVGELSSACRAVQDKSSRTQHADLQRRESPSLRI